MSQNSAKTPENAAYDCPVTIEGSTLRVFPTHPTIHLKTADDVRIEMAKVYRGAKSGDINTADATKLVYILSQIGRMIETNEIQTRVEAVERVLTERKRK